MNEVSAARRFGALRQLEGGAVATPEQPAVIGGTPVRGHFLVFGQPLIGEESIA